jgi:hypothetical protein
MSTTSSEISIPEFMKKSFTIDSFLENVLSALNRLPNNDGVVSKYIKDISKIKTDLNSSKLNLVAQWRGLQGLIGFYYDIVSCSIKTPADQALFSVFSTFFGALSKQWGNLEGADFVSSIPLTASTKEWKFLARETFEILIPKAEDIAEIKFIRQFIQNTENLTSEEILIQLKSFKQVYLMEKEEEYSHFDCAQKPEEKQEFQANILRVEKKMELIEKMIASAMLPNATKESISFKINEICEQHNQAMQAKKAVLSEKKSTDDFVKYCIVEMSQDVDFKIKRYEDSLKPIETESVKISESIKPIEVGEPVKTVVNQGIQQGDVMSKESKEVKKPKESVRDTVNYIDKSIQDKRGELLRQREYAVALKINEFGEVEASEATRIEPDENEKPGWVAWIASGLSAAASYVLPRIKLAGTEENTTIKNFDAALAILKQIEQEIGSLDKIDDLYIEKLKKYYNNKEENLEVKKVYQAVVEGILNEKIKIISEPLAVDVSDFDLQKTMRYAAQLLETEKALKKIHFDAESVDLNKKTELDKLFSNIERHKEACKKQLTIIVTEETNKLAMNFSEQAFLKTDDIGKLEKLEELNHYRAELFQFRAVLCRDPSCARHVDMVNARILRLDEVKKIVIDKELEKYQKTPPLDLNVQNVERLAKIIENGHFEEKDRLINELNGLKRKAEPIQKYAQKYASVSIKNLMDSNIYKLYASVVNANESNIKAKAQMAARKGDVEFLQIEINKIKNDKNTHENEKPRKLLAVVQALKEKMAAGKKEFSSVGMGNFEKMLEEIERPLVVFLGQDAKAETGVVSIKPKNK